MNIRSTATTKSRVKRTSRAAIAAAILGAFSLTLAACGGGDAQEASGSEENAAGAGEVRIYSCCVSGTEIPVWLAYDQGLFEKHGIEASELQMIPPPTGGSALISNSVDIGNDSPSVTINASASGDDQLVMVAGKTSRPVYRIMSNALEDPSELEGKKLGVSGPFAPPALAAYAYLKENYGLEKDKDYEVVPSAKISDLVATLANDSVDAAILSTPLYLASEEKGAHELADLSGNVAEGNSYVTTTRAFAEEHPEAVEGYLKAIIEAMHVAQTDEATTIDSIMKHQSGLAEEDAKEVYEDYAEILDPNMYEDALQTYIDFPSTPEVAKVDVTTLMDDSFLKKLDDDGFLEEMGFSLDTSGVTP